jgi:hypothetical protein
MEKIDFQNIDIEKLFEKLKHAIVIINPFFAIKNLERIGYDSDTAHEIYDLFESVGLVDYYHKNFK